MYTMPTKAIVTEFTMPLKGLSKEIRETQLVTAPKRAAAMLQEAAVICIWVL